MKSCIWRPALLAVLTLLRLGIAARMPLSADEAYYRIWAHALAAGYPDHPPMVALFIRAGVALGGDTALGIRLLGPIAAMLGSLLLVQAGTDLARAGGEPDRTRAASVGWQAAWLLNATLLCNAGAVIMTPDTPLLLFWTAAIAAAARAIRTGNASWFLAVGLAAGLAMDSKYTAALLAPALLVWLAAVPEARVFLRRWQPYAGAAIATILFSPVFAWNAAHDWVSFIRQGGRSGVFHPAEAGRFLAELLGGQIGLATPLLFLVFGVALVRCARHGAWRRPANGLVLAVTVIPALVFLQHAMGGARVQANWPGVIYPGSALAAALTAVPLRRAAIAVGATLSAALSLQAAFAPLVLPRAFDFTLIRLAGWADLASTAGQMRRNAGASFIASDEYGLASELAFHSPGMAVVAVEPRWAMIGLPHAQLAGQTGVLILSNRAARAPDTAIWPGAVVVGTTKRSRGGVVAETYTVYRVHAPRAAETVILPPPAN